VLDPINSQGRVGMKSADVRVVCPAFQDNIAALPIAGSEDNVLFLNFSQRAILTQTVKYLSSKYLQMAIVCDR